MSALGVKTPAEIKDFTINWATDLGTDTISTSAWAVSPAGPSIASNTNTSQAATVWISGGTLNAFYDVTNTITTAGGRTLSETFKLEVVAANYL
jgi:hypothetical protein